jgi:hypothetical protein
MTDAYGRRRGERLQVEKGPAIVAQALQSLAMKLASAVAIMTLVLTPAHAVEPFGVATTPSQSAGLITLWRDLQTELAKDEVEITRCRINANCDSAAAQRLLAIIDEARQHSGRKMIGHLNRGINGAIQSTRGALASTTSGTRPAWRLQELRHCEISGARRTWDSCQR